MSLEQTNETKRNKAESVYYMRGILNRANHAVPIFFTLGPPHGTEASKVNGEGELGECTQEVFPAHENYSL